MKGLAIVLALLAVAGCASTSPNPATPAAFPRSSAARPAPAPITDARVSGPRPAWLETALGQRGVPYRLGGANPREGFDCSGLVQYAFQQNGIVVPRTTAGQFGRGVVVSRQDIAPGDLVFFSTTGPGPTHVGIVLDSSTFVHAPDAGGVVRTERLETPYWVTRFLGARRIAAPISQ